MIDKRIVERLSKELDRTPGTVKVNISLLANRYPHSTPNARAQIYAVLNGTTVRRFLSRDDKVSLPSPMPTVLHQQSTQGSRTASKRQRKKERISHFVRYDTKDTFRLAHIDEANRAYTYKCYTAVFILCRKIMENLVADILRMKFPATSKENKELYFDIDRGRTPDFKELLTNLKSKRAEFEMDKKLVERILTKVQPFKDDADQKAHSWYHIVKTKKEIDDMEVQTIFDLIHELEAKVEAL